MKNCGVSALATAYTLIAASEATTLSLVAELQKNATDRLQAEYQLGMQAIKGGSPAADERHKIDVWAKWYVDAIGKMTDINVVGVTSPISSSIASAQKTVSELNGKLNEGLK